MNTLLRIARKELWAFFSSPAAFVVLGTFLAAALFAFFWVETFFVRNITELRPLFQWLPVLLIFLAAALTMRSWAEERRAGTLEFLLAAPVQPLTLVLGKFLACLAVAGLALLLTLPLPVTVSLLGPLDWGPVVGGYLAALCLAAAYIAVGLFVSIKAESQTVSLIITTLICGVLYLIGSDTLTALTGTKGAEILRLLGSGARFRSITRGVIDLRDIYYYLCLTGIFISLNIYGLEQSRWAGNPSTKQHRAWQLAAGLVVLNLLVANFCLAPLGMLRTDLTEGRIYSISAATRSYLQQLREPLLIRGYFSAQTHPLLAPLVPRLRDLMEEYAVAGGGKVRVEFIDPAEHAELEQEAGQQYGIRPVPFQTASKYQAAVTNSYFDILVRYGDQFEALSFRDLIEVKAEQEQGLEVELRNPEYDITRAIKKVLYSYQGGGDLFTAINKPLSLTAYCSPDEALPEELRSLKAELLSLTKQLEGQSKGRFTVSLVDPEADGGKTAQYLRDEYGFQPMTASLLAEKSFWFYLTLSSGEQIIEIPLPEDLKKASLEQAVQAGIKRFATGFAKTVALSLPENGQPGQQFGVPSQGMQYSALRDVLSQEHVIKDTDLRSGQVPAEADILILAGPEELDATQLFALDQFLMQGGTVLIAASPYRVQLENELALSPHKTGLEDWLSHHGLSLRQELVLDQQNSPFPVPAERNLGGFTVQEIQLVKYPYFVDLRPDSMNNESGLIGGLQQLTMNWTSPIEIKTAQQQKHGRKVVRLLESSAASWVSAAPEIQPDFAQYPELGFPLDTGKQGRQLLAAAVEGSFTSYYAGKPSPLLKQEESRVEANPTAGEEQEKQPAKQVIIRQLDKSPDTARIILFASESFLSDTILSISSSVARSNYLAPVQLVANTVDWSLEDRGLLALRGRSHFSRPLRPLEKKTQLWVEYLNYGLVFCGLVLVWLIQAQLQKRRHQAEQELIRPLTERSASC